MKKAISTILILTIFILLAGCTEYETKVVKGEIIDIYEVEEYDRFHSTERYAVYKTICYISVKYNGQAYKEEIDKKDMNLYKIGDTYEIKITVEINK